MSFLRRIALATTQYYHGSDNYLEIGTILKPQGRIREIPNYDILEKYRPSHMLAHKDAVFMVGDDEDIDNVGGGTTYVFTIVPLGKVEKHDLGWSTELSKNTEPSQQKKLAENYWYGKQHPNGVWEYLTPSAKIIKVEDY